MIEVLVAVLISAIAAAGLIGLFAATTRSSGFSRHSTEATVLAQDAVEKLRLGTATGSNTATGLDVFGNPGGIFTRTWTVSSGTNYADLDVQVSWNEEGITRSVRMRARRNNP
jgi:Tfp pilus assembly protein PilV